MEQPATAGICRPTTTAGAAKKMHPKAAGLKPAATSQKSAGLRPRRYKGLYIGLREGKLDARVAPTRARAAARWRGILLDAGGGTSVARRRGYGGLDPVGGRGVGRATTL